MSIPNSAVIERQGGLSQWELAGGSMSSRLMGQADSRKTRRLFCPQAYRDSLTRQLVVRPLDAKLQAKTPSLGHVRTIL